MIRSVIKLFFFSILLSAPFIEASGRKPRCYHQIAQHFFSEDVVSQALSLYQVPASIWDSILKDLRDNESAVESIMETRARKMRPNPLRAPFDPDKVYLLLESVLFDIFFKTINYYNVIDPNSIRAMFNYVMQRESSYIKDCLYSENS